ncbi:hypothetical protein NDU88_001911 [Pleurodeles waltl]|uniref:Uncharacterized protein n=1 Tax=Pleurodeles waltl TaxID=8319 RepID=A0AAV7LZ04_PLEWA|nr:hypothetical protein NDU88_001911 [Pleurodeles waltl]
MRIEKWILRPQEYCFSRVNWPGAHNPVDYFSRHFKPDTVGEESEAEEIEEYVKLVVERLRPIPISLPDIFEKTKSDDCLQLAIATVSSGNWDKVTFNRSYRTAEEEQALTSFRHVQDQLAISLEG